MANNLAGKGKDPGRREAMRMALTGEWPRRLLRGELVVDDVFIRDVVGSVSYTHLDVYKRQFLDRP